MQAPAAPWSLYLRVPAWAGDAMIRDDAGDLLPLRAGSYWSSGPRSWRPGDTVTLELGLRARVTSPDPRIDAVRGCVAIERGPLVYCLETADLPPGVAVEEVRLEADVLPTPGPRPDIGPGVVGLDLPAVRRRFDRSAWPYGEPGRLVQAIDDSGDGAGDTAIDVRAIPYFAWANRSVDAMRVWIPLRSESPDRRQ